MDQPTIGNGEAWPACVGVEEAAKMLGWPDYFLPVLMRAGHLKPLGKPSQNSRKWFATVELQHLARDREWLDKAIRIVENHVQQMNCKQRNKGPEEIEALVPLLGKGIAEKSSSAGLSQVCAIR